MCQRWALSYSPCKCALAVGIGNLLGYALETPLGPESRWTQPQKHRSTRGVRRQPAIPGENQVWGRCPPRSNPYFVAPPHAAPCRGWLSKKKKKTRCLSVLYLVFLKLIFYRNHNKNHQQQKSTILVIIFTHKGFSGGSAVRNLPAMQEPQEMWVQSLDWEDALEKEMATHCSILAWRIP